MYYLFPGKVIKQVVRGEAPEGFLWQGESLATAPAELMPDEEIEPDWEGFKAAIRPNAEFLALVDSSGAAARLADAIDREDLAAARDYWQFLYLNNRISPTLEAAITEAATEAGLEDELIQVSGN